MGTKERLNLEGHKALITGSSQGIGAAVALSLAEFGADVVIHCRGEVEKANAVAEKARAYGVNAAVIVCDLTASDAHEQLYKLATEAIGNIDILVLNAALQIRKKWYEITSEEFDKQIQVTFKNNLFSIQLFSKYMIEKGWGRIITMGSVNQHKPHVDMMVYAACKSAQENMVRNLAKQIGNKGVTINNIEVGVVDTAQNTAILENPEYMKLVLSRIPLEYIALPQDIAPLINLLCSDAGRYFCGANIPIDGGMSIL
ncbi:MAG: SDR family NAD(P)-dependent oxidoreductase [Paludibacter sp.]